MANYIGTEKQVTIEKDKRIHWAGGRIDPPPDNPKCGFDGSKCPKEGKETFYLMFLNVYKGNVEVSLIVFKSFPYFQCD